MKSVFLLALSLASASAHANVVECVGPDRNDPAHTRLVLAYPGRPAPGPFSGTMYLVISHPPYSEYATQTYLGQIRGMIRPQGLIAEGVMELSKTYQPYRIRLHLKENHQVVILLNDLSHRAPDRVVLQCEGL